MKKIDRVLKQLSELYDFNRKLKAYRLKDGDNPAAGDLSSSISTAPHMRTRIGPFTEPAEPEAEGGSAPTAPSHPDASEP